MTKLVRITATVASSLSLVAGFAGVVGASPASISQTGFNSNNRAHHSSQVRTDLNNTNNLGVKSSNPQYAQSGNVNSDRNTNGGQASTGRANNSSTMAVAASVDNSGSNGTSMGAGNLGGMQGQGSDASINTTGADSNNTISSRSTVRTTVNNTNNVDVQSNNSQTAVSGSANVSKNTSAGSATTGDATNNSTTTVDLNFKN